MFENKDHKQAWKALMALSDESSIPIPCTNFPEAFFPEMGERNDMAKSLCHECPIMSACGEYGILYELDGVYGGMSGLQRRQMRQLRKLKPLAAQYVAEPVQSTIDPLLSSDLAHSGELTDLL